jgi:ribosomal protein S18 acetylase RimI-like enzyme
MEVRRATTPEQIRAAAHLFDETPRAQPTAVFLADPRHHLLIAYLDGAPVGFVSGVVTVHPDKGDEMFLMELGVDDAAQGRGVGTVLVREMCAPAAALGCTAVWTVTEPENDAARATYRRSGATSEDATVTFVWDL